MNNQHFNLVNDPWIKVITNQFGSTKLVSLMDLFEHAQEYQRLGGETEAQDLSIMRLLLAILQTVYSRFDANDEVYAWLDLDKGSFQTTIEDNPAEDDLIGTWQTLHEDGHFSKAVIDYLNHYADRFDFFGNHAFYQVTTEEYDTFVPSKKKVSTGSGTVAIKQINRTISESNNSPALFAPKASEYKNHLDLPQLIRWIIMYQNYTGVTDKTKIETDEKFSVGMGWLYRLKPVYVRGDTLFETLMMNLVLVSKENDELLYHSQHPVWEFGEVSRYVEMRKQQMPPDNIAELYTAWSRLLHIEWNDGEPTIFSAGLPPFNPANLFVEPMTTWRYDSKANPPEWRPERLRKENMDVSMWRHFGSYVNTNKDEGNNGQYPGVVKWMQYLKVEDLMPFEQQVVLQSVAMVSDGNATSQSPAAEVTDDITIDAGVLLDSVGLERWPVRIEDQINLTRDIGKIYWRFVNRVSQIRGFDDNNLANLESGKFYNRLNDPFKDWLAGLNPDDDREQKIIQWQKTLRSLVLSSARLFLENPSPREIIGVIVSDKKGERVDNIFKAFNSLVYAVNKRI